MQLEQELWRRNCTRDKQVQGGGEMGDALCVNLAFGTKIQV